MVFRAFNQSVLPLKEDPSLCIRNVCVWIKEVRYFQTCVLYYYEGIFTAFIEAFICAGNCEHNSNTLFCLFRPLCSYMQVKSNSKNFIYLDRCSLVYFLKLFRASYPKATNKMYTLSVSLFVEVHLQASFKVENYNGKLLTLKFVNYIKFFLIVT